MKFSLCMIVKNEEAVLNRCLESMASAMDEIIIVDTGSTDATKKIAAAYTDQIYDFAWTGNFAEARNYAASKATGDYIYTADADEYLEPEELQKLLQLKKVLLPEVEIVQMLYCTPPELSTVYNFAEEYRPKLYKRLRSFTWIDPIHETLRLEPVVFDSEIRIQHRPSPGHVKRDLEALAAAADREKLLSDKLRHMYAMELYRCGDVSDFNRAKGFFQRVMEDPDSGQDALREAICVLTRGYRLEGDVSHFLAYALRDAVTAPTSELCCELGAYFEECGDLAEAAMWYQNALSETESILDARTGNEIPTRALERF